MNALPTDCVRCAGELDAHGYGRARVDGRRVGAHVAACIEAHGPIPRGYVVRHLCADRSTKRLGTTALEDRACVNGRHLRAGSVSENALDRERARRTEQRRAARPNPDRRFW